MIDRMLLSNPHRTTLILEPDRSLDEREDADEKARLNKIEAAMKQDDLERVIENAKELKNPRRPLILPKPWLLFPY